MIGQKRVRRAAPAYGALAFTLLLLSPLPARAASDKALAASRAWQAEHGAAILQDLAELLALPNVAADLPNVRANAEAIATRLRRRGAEVELPCATSSASPAARASAPPAAREAVRAAAKAAAGATPTAWCCWP